MASSRPCLALSWAPTPGAPQICMCHGKCSLAQPEWLWLSCFFHCCDDEAALEHGLFKALPGFVMNNPLKYACVMGNTHAWWMQCTLCWVWVSSLQQRLKNHVPALDELTLDCLSFVMQQLQLREDSRVSWLPVFVCICVLCLCLSWDCAEHVD